MSAPNLLDVFSGNAFEMESLTAAINNLDHVPGRAGELAFVGTGVGVNTTKVAIESRNQELSLIPTSPRGAPATVEVRDPRTLFDLTIPHIEIADTITAASIQDVRAFGTAALESVSTVVNDRLVKMASRLDLTLEHKRLGALKGVITDADGSVLTDLYSAFGVSPPATVEFPAVSSESNTLRVACQNVTREIFRAAKLLIPAGAQVVALCGDEFFDTLVSHPDVTTAFANWEAAKSMLAGNAVTSGFEFGGISFENYRGTDDTDGTENSEGDLIGSVGIVSNEARLFLVGVPGLYQENYAPADDFDSVNGAGLPRYAKIIVEPFGKYAQISAQSNPLPLCLRPQTLRTAVFA